MVRQPLGEEETSNIVVRVCRNLLSTAVVLDLPNGVTL